MAAPIVEWLRRHDPEHNALHKAIKVAVVVSVGLAIGTLVIGNSQLSLFASFGGVALLLFADFPGSRTARLGAYLLLVVAGIVLISLGTLASALPWVAVLGMAVIGFIVLFAGVLSAATAAATRAALLAFILPVTVPGTAADIPSRLAGWGIAAVLAVPVAVLIWPPRDHDALRAKAATACRALGRQLAGDAGVAGPGHPGVEPGVEPGADPGAAGPTEAIDALRQQFRSTTFRPVGLTTGSRLLMQLVDRLEWIRAVATRIPGGAAERWPTRTRDLVAACGTVLLACARALDTAGHRPTLADRRQLAAALRELERARARVAEALQLVGAGDVAGSSGPDSPVVAVDRQVLDDADEVGGLSAAVVHELCYTTMLAGQTVAVSAAADARPLLDRLLGRHTPDSVIGPLTAARRIAVSHITRRSVWFQNSVRGALGLAFAVLLAEVTEISHGFWVVLGAMSVLRSSALTTGSTALRALVGTFLGFLVGAALVLVIGTSATHLWAVLPFVILVAAFLPEAVSFTAGQAAFTVMVVILFNIIEPVGWSVGLVRIEDIALGCAAGLVSGVLLWPRGAAAQIRATLADSYRASADALATATRQVTGPAAQDADVLEQDLLHAKAAAGRLDDAFREYLSERGAKSVPLRELTGASNGANRIRLAAEAIAMMSGPAGQPTSLDAACLGLTSAAATTGRWFDRAAAVLAGSEPRLDPPREPDAERAVLTSLRRNPTVLADPPVAARARTVWAVALYVDDATRLQSRLAPMIDVLARPSRRADRAGDPSPAPSSR